MADEVLTYSEDAGLAREVAAAGSEVAAALGGEAAAVEPDEPPAGGPAAGKTVVAKGGRKIRGDEDAMVSALAEIAKARHAKAVLVASTRSGRAVGARVAARLRVGSLGTAKRLGVDAGRLVATREVYGGKFVARVAARLPCVAMVQPGAYQPRPVAGSRVEEEKVSLGESRVRTLEVREKPSGTVDLRTAQIIVSAGRGFSKREDLALAEGLARSLGAALGCSRPLSSDLGWLGEERHIGLTGVYVHPRLYVAVGISGQLQHVAGIKDSKTIVAINNDKQAPIFQAADYGIVGDLYQVVPALTKLLGRPAE